LRDARADRGEDPAARGTKALHRVQRGFQDAAKRAFPARMRGADDTRLAVGEQHRRAVGRKNSQCETGLARCHSVALRPFADRPGVCDDVHGGGMDLENRDEAIRLQSKMTGAAGAVFDHVRARVARTCAGVEGCEHPLRHAALAREKAMLEMPKGAQRDALDDRHTRHASKSCGSVGLGRSDRHRLEEIAHLVARCQTMKRAVDVLCRLRRGAAFQTGGALQDAEALQEFALRHGAVHPCARPFAGSRKRREINMSGDVCFAGLGERVAILVGLERLERIARRADMMAIVDDEGGAVSGGDAVRDVRRDAFAGW